MVSGSADRNPNWPLFSKTRVRGKTTGGGQGKEGRSVAREAPRLRKAVLRGREDRTGST